MKIILLTLRHIYWRWMLTEARDFAYRLENTIARERNRARDAVNYAETMERRAAIEVISARRFT